ncbi:MAG: hypothetical protein Q4B94_04520 [Pseudomonadota bacterium]|nr:hypothetical protein [Pseudomonadota bacterium]
MKWNNRQKSSAPSADGYNPCHTRVLGQKRKSSTAPISPGRLQGEITPADDFHIYSFFFFLFIYINNLRAGKIVKRSADDLLTILPNKTGGHG